MIDIGEKFREKFDSIEQEYDELVELFSSVEIMSDHKLLKFYQTKLKGVEQIAQKIKNLKRIESDYDALVELKAQGENGLTDELLEFKQEKEKLTNEIKELLMSQKEKEQENILIEITSKEDFGLCEILSKLFENYSENKGFEFQKKEQTSGNLKLEISGDGVYDCFKTFSGKIKRILNGVETICLVVVLKDFTEDVLIDEKDLVIQTSKSSGAGGQHINKTESAVKITHVPTGIFAECQDERSQTKNKEKAMEALIKKITQNKQEKAKKLEKNQRNELKNQIFSSTPALILDFDANKVMLTKNKTEYKLRDILNGELGLIINNSVE